MGGLLVLALGSGCAEQPAVQSAAVAATRPPTAQGAPVTTAAQPLPPLLKDLVADSTRGITLAESQTLHQAQLDATTRTTAQAYVVAHPDQHAYHLLFALRRLAPATYQQVPAGTRAAVLCAALAQQTYLNDWGYLDVSGSYDGEAALALLELGPAAQAPLIPLLADRREALLFGSEEATLSTMYQYRRNDFAYRYLTLIRGEQPTFADTPAHRDAAIHLLQQQLAAPPP